MAELISMPKLGFDMAEGLLQEWLKKVGDAVTEGETIALVETDKASVEVPAFRAGVLLKILVEAGTSVPIGTPIAVIGSAGETVDLAALGLAGASPAAARPVVGERQAERPQHTAAEAGGPRMKAGSSASPVALRMAAELGIDLRQVTGSGPGGRIIKRDIEAYLKEREKAPPKSCCARRPCPPPPTNRRPGRLHAEPLYADASDHRAAHGREQATGASLLHHHGSGHGRRHGVAHAVECAPA